MAHAFIDCVAKSGADAVKFQTHIASAESTPGEPWRVKFSKQDVTRYEYWKRMEFTPEQWAGLKNHADAVGLVFLSSPFSGEAVELLRRLGIAAWKIASGELTNLPMIEEIAKDRLPMILSTGMSPFAEIDAAIAAIERAGTPYAVLQCTTQYPSPPEAVGMNVVDELRKRYQCSVGLSDHSGTIYPALAVVAAHGAEVVELHLTMSRDMFGPDVPVSLTPQELRIVCDGVRFIERMKRGPVDKTQVGKDVLSMREIFFKSVVPLSDLAAGTVLTEELLGLKKPATGIPAAQLRQVIGRRLVRAVRRDVPLRNEDLTKT
jgi:N-acetylneuraminate synthase